MKIVGLRERTVSIGSSMKNAFIDFSQMTVTLAAVITDAVRDGRRIVGFGFNSNGRYGQSGLLRERFFPRLLAEDPRNLVGDDGLLDPWRVRGALMRNEKPGGHGERSVAVGIIDMAVWDAISKAQGEPLSKVLSAHAGREPASLIPVYAAGGYYYEDGTTGSLKDEMREYLDMGYTSVKMKIGGASLSEDMRRIEAVVDLVGDPAQVAVDANARFTLRDALDYAIALDPVGLRWFEEPVDPLDYWALSEFSAGYRHPVATGENLFSAIDAVNLARFGGMRPDRDLMQVDPVLSYGLVEYMDTLSRLDDLGWPSSRQIPHGGSQMNLAAAAALGLGAVESYPRLFAPFGGFGDSQTIRDGYVGMHDGPGIGLEDKAGLRVLMEDLAGDVS